MGAQVSSQVPLSGAARDLGEAEPLDLSLLPTMDNANCPRPVGASFSFSLSLFFFQFYFLDGILWKLKIPGSYE